MEIIDTSIGMAEKSVIDKNIQKLQEEIAFLSKTQRTILIQYYYEEKKQSEIAEFLKLPIGTVKWHLNIGKQELRKGMDKMREASELKFNLIVFEKIGIDKFVELCWNGQKLENYFAILWLLDGT